MRCPICKKLVEPDSANEQPNYPFCSDRCKLIDLGRWLSGKYTIPVESPGDPIEQQPRSAPENP